MATLNEVFEKIAAAQPLDSEERILWLNFLNQSSSVDAKVGAMAPGQSQVTRLSQITNNAGRLTRGEYISPANENSPYPENADFTGTVMDQGGIRGINNGVLQFELNSADGKAYAGGGAIKIDEDGISFPQRGSDGIIWGSLEPSLSSPYGSSISSVGNGLKILTWRYLTEQLLTYTNFEGGMTGWSVASGTFEITTHPDISGNVLHCLSAGQVRQSRIATSGTATYFLVGRVLSSNPTVRLYFYDAETGGNLLGTLDAEVEPSGDFVTVSNFGIRPAGTTHMELNVILETGDFASSFSVSRATCSALVLQYDIINAFGILYSDKSVETSGYVYAGNSLLLGKPTTPESIDASMVSIFAKTDGELYKLTSVTEKRLLTTDDTPTTATVGALINGADAVTTPGDTDRFALAVSGVLKYVTWANIKATLKTYFDTLYNKYVHPDHTGDVTSVADGATTIGAQKVGISKMLVTAASRLLGRVSAGSGAAEELTVGGGLEFSGSQLRTAAFTGDVTKSAGGTAQTIANDAVTNAKLANMAASTIKGRITASTGDPEDLTAAQAKLITQATNYITGLKLSWASSTTITVGTGEAYVNGVIVAVSSPITSGTITAADDIYHVYLYNNSGSAAIEVSTTDPATSPYSGTAYTKNGDTSRRYLGSVLCTSGGGVQDFLHAPGTGLMMYTNVNAPKRILANGGATTKTAVSTSSVIPTTGKMAQVIVINTNATYGLQTYDTNSNGFLYIPPSARASSAFPLDSGNLYYAMGGAGNGAYLDITGYYFER